MITAGRKIDAVISVCQNNKKKILEIQNVNFAAEQLLGQYNKSLKNHSLYEIMTPESVEKISDFLDFEDHSSDLANVLNKMRKLEIIGHNGNAISVTIKAFYSLSNNNLPIIELLIKDISLCEKIAQLKKQLQTNRSNPTMIEEDTGVMNKESFLECLSLVSEFINHNPIDTCIAMINIINYKNIVNNYGTKITKQFITEIVNRYNDCTRTEDVIGSLQENSLGVILFNCSAQDAVTVATRIKHKILSSPIMVDNNINIVPEVNIDYISITPNTNIYNIIDKCEKLLSHVSHNS
ncbi:MAG: diguanylate cyclase [Rickettsiales endosymbiont of Dermacentor nuttalli]